MVKFAGPVVRVGRKLFGSKKEEDVTWLRSGKNRKQAQMKTRSRRSMRVSKDLQISDSETEEEEIVVSEEEEVATCKLHRVATGQGKVWEIHGQGKVWEFLKKSGKFRIF